MKPPYKKPLTLEQLAQLSDDQIDTSDIPERDGEFWSKAKVSPPRTKPNVSLRLPPEVIDFFKTETPHGYTSRMAAVLSAYVEANQLRCSSSPKDGVLRRN